MARPMRCASISRASHCTTCPSGGNTAPLANPLPSSVADSSAANSHLSEHTEIRTSHGTLGSHQQVWKFPAMTQAGQSDGLHVVQGCMQAAFKRLALKHESGLACPNSCLFLASKACEFPNSDSNTSWSHILGLSSGTPRGEQGTRRTAGRCVPAKLCSHFCR